MKTNRTEPRPATVTYELTKEEWQDAIQRWLYDEHDIWVPKNANYWIREISLQTGQVNHIAVNFEEPSDVQA